jgi:hypothetical protein
MRDQLHDMQILSFETRMPVDLKTKVEILNTALELKLRINNRVRSEVRYEQLLAERTTNRVELMRLDQRLRHVVEEEWLARLPRDIMRDQFWFDIKDMREVVNRAIVLAGGIHVPGVNHFVAINDREIRIFAAKMF